MNKTSLLALILLTHAGALMAAAKVNMVIEPPMAAIPAGAFAMGSETTTATDGYPVEQPVHQVRLAGFQLSKYEVTVKQYRQFVEATGYKGETQCWKVSGNEWGMELGAAAWNSPPYPQGDYHPVACVSWDDAKAYAAWLAAQTGKPYRLPSEAEWEYAARAGSAHSYHFGADAAQVCRYGNVRDTVGNAAIGKVTGKPGKDAGCTDFAGFTSVAGMYEPNGYGLYDMVGNVGEIVEDCEHQNYQGAPMDGSAWTTNCSKEMKMHRGGSFLSVMGGRSTARSHTGPDNASSFEGFRLALSSSASPAPAASSVQFEAELAQARAAERTRRKAAL